MSRLGPHRTGAWGRVRVDTNGDNERYSLREPSRRPLIGATVALLALWAVVTVLARPLTPVVARAAEVVEVALGLDVAKASEEDDA